MSFSSLPPCNCVTCCAYAWKTEIKPFEKTAFDLRPRSDAYFLERESFERKRRVKVDFRPFFEYLDCFSFALDAFIREGIISLHGRFNQFFSLSFFWVIRCDRFRT